MSLKEEVIDIISNIEGDATMEEIKYRIGLLESIREGQGAIERGEEISHEDLEKEIDTW